MNSKIIIVTTLVLLLASFSVLFVLEKKVDNYDYGKNWTVVYFKDAAGNSPNFFIENHQGVPEKYTYEIFEGDQSVAKDSISIPAGGKQEVTPILAMDKINQQNASRVSAEVNLGDVKYKIYKDIK